MKRYFAAIAISMACTLSHSEFVDGNKLHKLAVAVQRIESSSATVTEYMDASEFSGYIKGVVDTHQDYLKCLPDKLTVGQLSAIVRKYLDDHPETWSFSGNLIVYMAVLSAFPCKK